MKIDELEIEKLEKYYELSCKVFEDTIYVNSGRNEWIIEVKQGHSRVTLKHKNNGDTKFRTHKEKKYHSSVRSAFKWIKSHEKNVHSIIKKGRKRKTKKIDILFDEIAR